VLRQREPRYENRKLLDLAHETPCMAQFEHDCNGYLGCVPAHRATWRYYWTNGKVIVK
jgi:hypothetical protein